MTIFDLEREFVAYGIIGTIAIVAIPVVIVALRRRKREKLRRRGIKTYGH